MNALLRKQITFTILTFASIAVAGYSGYQALLVPGNDGTNRLYFALYMGFLGLAMYCLTHVSSERSTNRLAMGGLAMMVIAVIVTV